jgi:methionyl-tRNA formyltransferase
MKYVFCAHRKWALELYQELSKKHKEIKLLKDPKKLSFKQMKKINPEFIFFPDWSWIVPKDIVSNFKCVCIHESDLPKFRGGSPIQNQIIRDKTKTKSTAFLMNQKIDQGDILLKKDLSLEGSLNEIFDRIKKNDFEIINNIIAKKYKPKKQKGKPTLYKRRMPIESELKNLDYSKKYLYNFIRMLSDPYPNAFTKIGKRKIVFKTAKLKNNKLSFEGEII